MAENLTWHKTQSSLTTYTNAFREIFKRFSEIFQISHFKCSSLKRDCPYYCICGNLFTKLFLQNHETFLAFISLCMTIWTVGLQINERLSKNFQSYLTRKLVKATLLPFSVHSKFTLPKQITLFREQFEKFRKKLRFQILKSSHDDLTEEIKIGDTRRRLSMLGNIDVFDTIEKHFSKDIYWSLSPLSAQ